MKRHLSRHRPAQIVCMTLLSCIILMFCGLTALAADGFTLDIEQPTRPQIAPTFRPPISEDMSAELFPIDVQTVTDGGGRRIVKTYILTAEQSPGDIPRDSFTRDGWRYELADITERRTSEMEFRDHTETLEINTETKELNEVIVLLSPTMDYRGDDGYCGLLALDLASINCEAAGYRSGSYTATATREYPHLSSADTSLIPKTITDNGRTLTLAEVSWEVQHYVSVDYDDIPESYRAIAKYTATVSTSSVTGYITTADYTGEVSRVVDGGTVYTVYFSGSEINPTPKPVTPPPVIITPTEETMESQPPEPPPSEPEANDADFSLVPLLVILAAIAAMLAGAGAYWFKLRHNVKVYKAVDGRRAIVAKDRISVKRPVIDLTPLDGTFFIVEISRSTAKSLNGRAVEVLHGATAIKHIIAYEGNTYSMEADFGAGTIKAIY